MDPLTGLQIAQLALGLGASLAEAFERHRLASDALGRMVAEGRGPTPEEIETLRAAGAAVDDRLDGLLGRT